MIGSNYCNAQGYFRAPAHKKRSVKRFELRLMHLNTPIFRAQRNAADGLHIPALYPSIQKVIAEDTISAAAEQGPHQERKAVPVKLGTCKEISKRVVASTRL